MGSSAEENDGVRLSGEQCVYSSGAHCLRGFVVCVCITKCMCVRACVRVQLCDQCVVCVCALFNGTRFSKLYTAVDTPAEAA